MESKVPNTPTAIPPSRPLSLGQKEKVFSPTDELRSHSNFAPEKRGFLSDELQPMFIEAGRLAQLQQSCTQDRPQALAGPASPAPESALAFQGQAKKDA